MMRCDKLWRIIFPLRCISCGKLIESGYACKSCKEKIHKIKEPKCAVCARPFGCEPSVKICFQCLNGRPYGKLFIPFEYNDSIRKAVRAMKYSCRPGIYRYFAREMVAEMGDFRPDFITYVPQDRGTHIKRGYNQTKLIAKEIGRLMNVKVIPTLIRKKRTSKQVALRADQRLKNAKKLFKSSTKTLSGTALIVDDVVTTGGTMDACCTLLKEMGCQKVYGTAIAKTIP